MSSKNSNRIVVPGAQAAMEQFKTEARRAEAMLTEEFRNFQYLNHDVGFMYLF